MTKQSNIIIFAHLFIHPIIIYKKESKWNNTCGVMYACATLLIVWRHCGLYYWWDVFSCVACLPGAVVLCFTTFLKLLRNRIYKHPWSAWNVTPPTDGIQLYIPVNIASQIFSLSFCFSLSTHPIPRLS